MVKPEQASKVSMRIESDADRSLQYAGGLAEHDLQHPAAGAPFATYSSGDMNFQLDGGYPWTLDIYNNISRAKVQGRSPGFAGVAVAV
jgi:hypothetical protein